MEQHVYVALHPTVIARHLEERRVEVSRHLKAVADFRASVGGLALHRVWGHAGSYMVRGLALATSGQELPEGWKQDDERLEAVPDRATAEGRLAAQALRRLAHPAADIPGVPGIITTEPDASGNYRFLTPRITLSGGDYLLVLPEVPSARDRAAIDPAFWAPAAATELHFRDQREQAANRAA